jgi:hypothetical protein
MQEKLNKKKKIKKKINKLKKSITLVNIMLCTIFTSRLIHKTKTKKTHK